MKIITWDESYIALNIYSPFRRILLAGWLAGLCLAIIFSICFFPIMSVMAPLKNFYWYSVLASVCGLSLAGVISAIFVHGCVKEAWDTYGVYDYNEKASYVTFFLGLMATGYCVLLGMHHLKFGIQAYLWVSPVVVALILSGFVCHIWRVIQGTFLGWLFPFNPNFLVNEKRFKDQLKLKLSEVKRYGGPFAVMAISLDRKKELIKKYGRRGWQNLNEEIMCLFNYNTRETDIFGQIGDGTIIMSLTHTDKQGVEHVVRRVYDHVKNRVFMLYKEEVTVSISMGVSFFSERLKDPEDLTLAAIAAVNRAITNGESEWVVYHELSD